MFGTLRARPCQLPTDDAQAWRRLYCGTCASLGAQGGLLARATLSYDAVLLAGVVEALSPEPATRSRCRCPLNPAVFKPTVAGAPVELAASVHLVLADAWAADQVADGNGVVGVVRPLLRGGVARSRDHLRTLGVSLAVHEDQQAAEAQVLPSIDEVAAPTGRAVADAFAAAARLTGTPEAPLRALGDAVGRAIYLIDALDDAPRDAATGDFNLCVVDGAVAAARVDAVVAVLTELVDTMPTRVDAVPWRRHEALIHQVLTRELPQRARRAMASVQVPPRPWWARLGEWIWCQLTPPRLLLAAAGSREDPLGESDPGLPPEPPGARKKSRGCHCGGCDSLTGVECVACCDCCECCTSAECGVGCCECGSCCEGAACCEGVACCECCGGCG